VQCMVLMSESRNIDHRVTRDFGREWSAFDQTRLSEAELRDWFSAYFSVFPWGRVSSEAKGFDLGCGSGRWAKLVAPRVNELHCIEPSEDAMRVAMQNLSEFENCRFHVNGVDDIPLDDESMDFGYSLGVLHHVPDTAAGIASCTRKLKPGAPMLLYLYYAFDNKPMWFKFIWRVSDLIRRALSIAPYPIKYVASQIIAALVYYPVAKLCRCLEKVGMKVDNLPLAAYRDKSFYTMRTDALDRFGTRLEQRFTKSEIEQMMRAAGLIDIRFSDKAPFWCAVGLKSE